MTTVGNILLATAVFVVVVVVIVPPAVVVVAVVVAGIVQLPIVVLVLDVLMEVLDGDNKEGILAGGLVGVYNFGNTGSGRHEDENNDFFLDAGVTVTFGIR